MKDKKQEKAEQFIKSFSSFYQTFFRGFVTSLELLMKSQKEFPEYWCDIQNFDDNPKSIEVLLSKLSNEEKGILLNMLLKSGGFSRRITSMFENSPLKQKKMIDDMQDFIKEIDENIK